MIGRCLPFDGPWGLFPFLFTVGFVMSDNSIARPLRACLRVFREAGAGAVNEAAAVDQMAGVVRGKLERWGVWPGVQRRLARLLVARILDAEWFDYTVESVSDRLARGEVSNPGALFVTLAKVELARRGHSWRVVNEKGVRA